MKKKILRLGLLSVCAVTSFLFSACTDSINEELKIEPEKSAITEGDGNAGGDPKLSRCECKDLE